MEDLYVEPVTGGKYLTVQVKHSELSRYGLSVDDVNMTVESALGGAVISSTVEGRKRFSISTRFAQDYRNSLESIHRIPLQSTAFGEVPLSSVADIRFEDGPAMINSENALLRGAVLFNVRDRDLGSTVEETISEINKTNGILPEGYFLEWSGQYENLIRGKRTLLWILPIVIIIIFLSLYFAFRSFREACFKSYYRSFCAYWWCLSYLFLGSKFIGCSSCWFYCIVWNCGRNRYCYDHLFK